MCLITTVMNDFPFNYNVYLWNSSIIKFPNFDTVTKILRLNTNSNWMERRYGNLI